MKLLIFIFTIISPFAFAGTLKITHIGDSQSVGTYGPELNKLLKNIPNSKVSTFASGGSGAENWLTGQATDWDYYEYQHGKKSIRAKKQPTPLISELLKGDLEEGDSQLVVIQQGGNMLWRSDEYLKEWIGKMMVEVKKSKSECVWIGPSNRRVNMDKIKNFYKILGEMLKDTGCHIVDSRKYTSYPKKSGDGVHFNFKGGEKITKEWAEKSIDEIKLYLAMNKLNLKSNPAPNVCE